VRPIAATGTVIATTTATVAPIAGALTTLGSEACVGELQARWAVATLTGTAAQQPTADEVRERAAARAAGVERRRPLFPNFANYVPYMDELAADIGCAPPPLRDVHVWAADPALWWRMWTGPTVPAQYRLRGPDADPDGARRVIMGEA
jgi:hypothetical protein